MRAAIVAILVLALLMLAHAATIDALLPSLPPYDAPGPRVQSATRLDEFGRPTCRRNAADPQRAPVRIGHPCL